MEQENSSVSGLNRRDGKRKQKQKEMVERLELLLKLTEVPLRPEDNLLQTLTLE